MNTEKMIPIDFSRNITPIILKDFLYNSASEQEFEVTEAGLKNISSGQNNDHLFVVSFADRPNTTGEQPVADDVVVDTPKTLGGPRAASELRWPRIGIIPTWKPNHEAMLAKFKEQGANTMNEQEHKAKSHEVALMTNALDDNPDEQVIEPESMIASSEFYQSNNPQVIEPYVADHLKGLINPVSEGCQAGDPALEANDKPVFTQEVELLIGGGKNVPEVYKAGRFVYHGSKYSIFVTGDGKEYSRKNSKIKTRPIDIRSEHEKALDWISEYNSIPKMMLCDIKDGKCPWLKWVGE